jgi:threonylcarbamoyladenosine tRNA methylthiotransferase MtaB
MSDPDIITFGCRLNAYESQVMSGHAREAGIGDAVIVNTCAVTAEAERQARQAIRRARRERPDARIVVTGCAAQIDPAAWSAMPEVDQVWGNQEKLDPQSFNSFNAFQGDDEPVRVNDIMAATDTAAHLVAGFDGRTRGFVQIQNGCDHRCTFCIIPFGRGNSRSVALGPIVEQVRTLVENGYREVVLTGVDITSWGADLPGQPGLGQMVRRLLTAVPDLPRLRLTSLDSVEVDNDLLDLIGTEPRLMPHLHLSLQAGDNIILKRMKRRHSREQAIEFCQRVRAVRPDVIFGADIITGFPTETEAQFQQSLDLVGDCGLTWLHVFPYSERPGTPAAQMPQVPVAVRKERAARLRAYGEQAVEAYLNSMSGKSISVLAEKPDVGRTEHYAMVRFAEAQTPGQVLSARVLGSHDGALLAEAA